MVVNIIINVFVIDRFSVKTVLKRIYIKLEVVLFKGLFLLILLIYLARSNKIWVMHFLNALYMFYR